MRRNAKLLIPKLLRDAILVKGALYPFRVWELIVSFLGQVAMLSQRN